MAAARSRRLLSASALAAFCLALVLGPFSHRASAPGPSALARWTPPPATAGHDEATCVVCHLVREGQDLAPPPPPLALHGGASAAWIDPLPTTDPSSVGSRDRRCRGPPRA